MEARDKRALQIESPSQANVKRQENKMLGDDEQPDLCAVKSAKVGLHLNIENTKIMITENI